MYRGILRILILIKWFVTETDNLTDLPPFKAYRKVCSIDNVVETIVIQTISD